MTMTNHQHIKNWLIMADPWQGTGKLQRRVYEWRGMGYESGDCGMKELMITCNLKDFELKDGER